jgi:N-acetylmuramoyl-L-alanine amidase
MRRWLPWLGLLLIVAPFAWLVHSPSLSNRATSPRKPLIPAPHPMVVVLDPGHGGDDSGAMCGTVMEKDLTLDVAQRAELLLRAAGFTTLLTRDNDRYVSLAERASLGDREENSIFISIHFNEGKNVSAAGIETYYSPGRPTGSFLFSWLPFLQRSEANPLRVKSQNLASLLQSALVGQTRATDRGTKTEPFYVIANVHHPAALVEGGFITNKADLLKLTTPEYRGQLAAAICKGARDYRAAERAEKETTLALAGAQPE